MNITTPTISVFQKFIWDFYRDEGRSFAWRNVANPYYILVSEIMLQQTQTYRVAPKFGLFIQKFPDYRALVDAPLRDVLAAWQGLGYSRRAMALQKCAQRVVSEFGGLLPNDPDALITFPGIGKATAASICAFAFNRPTVFIETNIRTVFLHHFFQGKVEVHDKELMPLIESALDIGNPREWYYALMDYGVALKKQLPNPNRRSKHHIKQSRFEGSDRQIRGMILKALTVSPAVTLQGLLLHIDREPTRIKKALTQLSSEGFIKKQKNFFMIS